MVALESMLLKDGGESVQQNVGERMAFLLGKSVDDRLALVSRFKKIYVLRSKFVHHGQSAMDMDLLSEFMFDCWRLFFHFVRLSTRLKSKAELMERLDRLKFSLP
jgi:hypothetical protein